MNEKGSDMSMSNNDTTIGIYDKIQDKLMFLGANAILNINLLLYSYSEKYGRQYYYREMQYISEKAGKPVRKISRDYDIYLSIENIKPINGYKEFIAIRAKDIEFMRMTLLPRLKSIIEHFDEVYQNRGNKLYVSDTIKPFEIDMGTKILIFAPGLYKSYNEEVTPCIDIFLNGSKDNVVNMSFNKVYELMYLIESIQLHNYAASMLSYLGRPPMETNMIDMTHLQEPIFVEENEPIRQNQAKPFYRQSYFNKKK